MYSISREWGVGPGCLILLCSIFSIAGELVIFGCIYSTCQFCESTENGDRALRMNENETALDEGGWGDGDAVTFQKGSLVTSDPLSIIHSFFPSSQSNNPSQSVEKIQN